MSSRRASKFLEGAPLFLAGAPPFLVALILGVGRRTINGKDDTDNVRARPCSLSSPVLFSSPSRSHPLPSLAPPVKRGTAFRGHRSRGGGGAEAGTGAGAGAGAGAVEEGRGTVEGRERERQTAREREAREGTWLGLGWSVLLWEGLEWDVAWRASERERERTETQTETQTEVGPYAARERGRETERERGGG
eukprot:385311-Rhodomonas_salina.1